MCWFNPNDPMSYAHYFPERATTACGVKYGGVANDWVDVAAPHEVDEGTGKPLFPLGKYCGVCLKVPVSLGGGR